MTKKEALEELLEMRETAKLLRPIRNRAETVKKIDTCARFLRKYKTDDKLNKVFAKEGKRLLEALKIAEAEKYKEGDRLKSLGGRNI